MVTAGNSAGEIVTFMTGNNEVKKSIVLQYFKVTGSESSLEEFPFPYWRKHAKLLCDKISMYRFVNKLTVLQGFSVLRWYKMWWVKLTDW